MLDNEKLYDIGTLASLDLSDLQASFDRLPEDVYAESRLRSRRYSCFHLDDDGNLKRHDHKEFMQSSDINDYLGDVERQYEEIEDDVLTNNIFIKMFQEFQIRTGLSANSIIEAHQMRWHCSRTVKIPAPEGNHQDGFDFIGMYAINAHNIDGGDLMLFEEKDGAPIYKKRLQPGDYLIVNDKKLFHNAAPLVPMANKDDGYWDLIVLTAHEANNQKSAAA